MVTIDQLVDNIMKNLVITLDFGRAPDWAVRAKQQQIGDWLQANKSQLSFDNIILLPSPGETKLFWLEGKVGDTKDEDEIKRIRDEMKPVLEIALGIKADTEVKYTAPVKNAIADLAAHRDLAAHKAKLHERTKR